MRTLVDGLCCDWAVSIRRACGALRMERSTYHYRSRRSDPAALRERVKEICETRVPYAYRRVHVQLRREGWFVFGDHPGEGVEKGLHRLRADLRQDEAERGLAVGTGGAEHAGRFEALVPTARRATPRLHHR